MAEPATTPVAPPEEQDVPVINPDGDLVRVAKADAAKALSPEGGYTVPSERQLAEAHAKKTAAELDAKNEKVPLPIRLLGGGITPTQQAMVSGGWSGATSGLGETGVSEALGALNPSWQGAYKKTLEEQKEAHDTAYGVSNLVGQGVSLYAGGSAGKFATGLGAEAGAAGKLAGLTRALPTALIGEAGTAVEGFIGNRLGGLAAKGVLGRAASTGIKLGVRGLTEGALIGSAQELNEEMLGDAPISAQKILITGAKTGAVGGVLGFGLGATGSLASSAAGGLRGLISETAAAHATTLANASDQAAANSLRMSRALAREAEELPGGSATVGKVVKKYTTSFDDLQSAATKGASADMGGEISAAREQVGKQIGDIIGGVPSHVKYGALLDDMEKAIAPTRGLAGHEHVTAALEKYKASLETKLGVAASAEGAARAANFGNPVDLKGIAGEVTPHQAKLLDAAMQAAREKTIPVGELFAQRKALDNLIYEAKLGVNPLTKEPLNAIRASLDDGIMRAVEAHGVTSGDPALLNTLKQAKLEYRALSIAEKATDNAAAAEIANRSVSPSDYFVGGTGAKVGAMIGGVMGGPVGAAGGALGGGLVAGAINKALRQNGQAIASVALDKVAKFGAAQQAIRQADEAIARAGKGVVAGATKAPRLMPEAPAGVARNAPVAKRYAAAVADVAQMSVRAHETMERITSQPDPHMPNTSAEMAKVLARSAAYLQSKVPPSPPAALGQKIAPSTDDVAAAQFLRDYDAIKRPDMVLHDLERGRVTKEGVEALKVVSPDVFAQVQKAALLEIADRQASGHPLGFDARMALGLRLEIPADPILLPPYLRAVQAAASQGGDKPAPPPGGGPATPVKSPSDATTNSFDRIESR